MSPSPAPSHDHLARLRLLRPFAGRLLAGLGFMLVSVVIQLCYPKALSYFIDHLAAIQKTAAFGRLAGIAMAVLAAQALVVALRYYLFDSTGHMIVNRIRRLLFDALIDHEIAFYDRNNVGELTNRLTADVELLHETLTTGLAISLRSVCAFIGALVMLLAISPQLSVILVLFLPASLYLGNRAGESYRTRAAAIQDSLAQCGTVSHEHLTNVRLIHAFNQQATARANYRSATEQWLSASLAGSRLVAVYRGMASLLLCVALVATLWLGSRLIGSGTLTVGDLTAFVIYGSMATDSAGAISDFWTTWMRTVGATDKIFQMIGNAPPATQPAQRLASLRGEIELADVVFSYPERPATRALDGVGCKVLAGQKIALVGASGAGKSTIASLILGFYRPDQGRISFDGLDSATLCRAEIRRHIAIVEQEPSLFSGSVLDNIAFALPDRVASADEVIAAAKLAHAHDFISAFPNGYATIVGERGVQLSGGQKQRIAIARALLRNPRILILDEATSALDSESEKEVQRALDTLMEGRTTLIIAHRYSTIVKADRILVLEHGRIVQSGAHGELMSQVDGLYQRLMRNQLAVGEDAAPALHATAA